VGPILVVIEVPLDDAANLGGGRGEAVFATVGGIEIDAELSPLPPGVGSCCRRRHPLLLLPPQAASVSAITPTPTPPSSRLELNSNSQIAEEKVGQV